MAQPSPASFSPRIFRVHGNDYYTDEVMAAPAVQTDQALAEIAAMGYDGIWLHCELRELIPTDLFRPYVPDHQARLAALVEVAQRSRRHGLGLWLYFNEPRCYPQNHPFWQEHPDCRGAGGKDTAIAWRRGSDWLKTSAMCLSSPTVRNFLRQATAGLFSAVPELAGALVITASEHHTHCYSHFHVSRQRSTVDCPRCQQRDPLEMPVVVAQEMQAGLRQAGSPARLAFWTWSWTSCLGPEPQQAILDQLPPEVALLADFERGEPITLAGKQMLVDEYAFAVVGPSQRFRRYQEALGTTGREMWAKLQVTTTHEISTMPNMPLPGLLYDKIAAARACGVRGVMATWTMALRPTLNAYTAGKLLACPTALPPRERFLADLAREYFGPDLAAPAAGLLAGAWGRFEKAMASYPSTMIFVYFSPTCYAPAYPWKLQRQGLKMARTWTNDPLGDNLEMTMPPFTLAEVAALLDELATTWLSGMGDCAQALLPLQTQGNRRAAEELAAAWACGLFFRSCADCYLFAQALLEQAPVEKLLALLDREERTCRQLLPILAADERIGWQDEVCRRKVDPALVEAKLANLAQLRAELALRPAQA